MQPIGQALKDITSTKSQSIFSKEVLETSTCECGKPFDSKYILTVYGKPKEHVQEKCDKCELDQAAKELADSILKSNAEQRKINIQRLFETESLMNPKLINATFESYQPTNMDLKKAKAVVERYADNFSKDNPVSLLLIGNYGTGKSHLAVSITKELLKKDFTCVFISTPKLLSKIRSTYNKKSDYTEEKIIETLNSVDCLVLDDIGAEQTKREDVNNQSWATSKLFEIIDNRIGKHTIFTTNFDIPELQQRLGGRNFSRMMEDVHIVKMYGDDYRLRNFK